MAYQPKSYKKFVATAATATLVATAVVPAAFADDVSTAAFTDVAPQYKDAVEFVVSQNIAKGKTETRFGISDAIIRGDAAIMVANAAKLNDETAPASGFSDVPTRGALAINSLKDAGVTNGKTPTQFGFNDNITRGEAAIFFANAFKLKADEDTTVGFTDVSDRYMDAVEKLVANGVTSGKSETRFGTGDNITRGEFARWLHALKDVIAPPEVDPEPKPDPEPVLGHTLEVTFGKSSLVGNGADNTQVTLTVRDENGAVATDADDIVLEVTTSHGTLGQDRVTVQDGVANVTLTSEYTMAELTATVQGKLIEAAADSEWHDEIGNLVASGTIDFTPVSSVVDETTVPSLLTAESNEADRVTLYFDKAVNPAMYLEMENGRYVLDADDNVVFRGEDGDITDGIASLDIYQNDGIREIRGLIPNPENPNSLIAILDVMDNDGVNPALTPNSRVTVDSAFMDGFGEALDFSGKYFTFTDSRNPELTKVEVSPTAFDELTLTFSEPITYEYAANPQITVNGQEVSVEEIEVGEFDQNEGDFRHQITVTVGNLLAANSSIQVSGLEDYAGNVMTSESQNFEVPAFNTAPAATVEVESPEQVRLNWNIPVNGFDTEEVAFQYYVPNNNPDVDSEGEWVAFPAGVDFVATTINDREYVYELNQDWTQFVDEMVAEVDEDGVEVSAEDFDYTNFQVRAVIATDAVTNPLNALLGNTRQVLDLNAGNSPLNTFDTASPVISNDVYRYDDAAGNYVGYVVEFNEPVKAPGLDVFDTPSVLQQGEGEEGDAGIPEVVVEFRGTNAAGNPVVIDGDILGYFPDFVLPDTSEDNAFIVDVAAGETALQALVDSGYGTEWELVVRNVTDDVGNAATTVLSDEFTINPTPAAPEVFQVFSAGYDGVDFDVPNDEIILDFTAAVSFTGGTANALNLSNYTVNGEELPEGTSIALSEDEVNDDLSIVTISLPEGYLNEDGNNVINISEELVSRNGVEISGKLEVTQDEAGTVAP
ncbi:S-layer homology domain-containing protein [Planomicrobium sp. YIM 101495]|uniref:S-layer homology domain-containing protein n=1 Tax=Planomicrobium sp. YIM 101495 TaxID=2665160 RepID=UPI0018AB353A|nr:S-layer homology domain-containing protein [Planomicrobium sp. YIM 101495]